MEEFDLGSFPLDTIMLSSVPETFIPRCANTDLCFVSWSSNALVVE